MSIHVFTALARDLKRPSLLPMVLDGRVQEAAALAEDLLAQQEPAPEGAATAELATLCGDLRLAQDRDAEAEEMYRRAVKVASAAPRGQLRVMSCRNTGFLSLYQQRFGTAAACFRRVADDAEATVAQKVEALCGLAWAHHGVGQKLRVMEALHDAASLAADAAGPASSLTLLAGLLRTDLLVQQELRNHAALRDHVFWQLPAVGRAAQAPVPPLAAIDACLAAHGGHALVAQRLRHLRALVQAGGGDHAAAQSLHDHLAWLRQAGLVLVLAGALTGCEHTPRNLYQWGGYQDQLYEHFKGDRESPSEQVRVLEAQAQKARAGGMALPPGFRAHLGMLYLQMGRADEARRQLEAEKASFPESAPYMDFLLKRMAAGS